MMDDYSEEHARKLDKELEEMYLRQDRDRMLWPWMALLIGLVFLTVVVL